jgi:hypothetical protein
MPRDVRVRQNMQFFREVNERTQQLEADLHSEQRIAFVCECGNLGCRAPVYLTVEEFRSVREVSGHFVVIPGHVDPKGDRVVGLTDHHAVVAAVDVEELAPKTAEPSGAQT